MKQWMKANWILGWTTNPNFEHALHTPKKCVCDKIYRRGMYSFLHYRKIYSIRRTKSPNLNVSRPVLQLYLPNSMKTGVFNEDRCQVENEDVVGAAPTGDAPTTSEWSRIYCLLCATHIRDLTVLLNFQMDQCMRSTKYYVKDLFVQIIAI